MIRLTEEEIEKVLAPLFEDIRNSGKLLELSPLLNKTIAKALLNKVYDWGDEDCPHSQERYLRPIKRQCSKCWQALLKEVEND